LSAIVPLNAAGAGLSLRSVVDHSRAGKRRGAGACRHLIGWELLAILEIESDIPPDELPIQAALAATGEWIAEMAWRNE
jgi:hypothetical protein